ncbi:protealysin inhibitor emfourin [Nocardioides pacificus]
MSCQFVPSYLLEHIAASRAGETSALAVPDPCRTTLTLDEQLRAGRRTGRQTGRGGLPETLGPGDRSPAWTVHTAAGGTALPGMPVRAAGEDATGDEAVDEAAAGITAALALFAEVWGRDSHDGRGAPVSLTVHYGRDYANAFWDGSQLVFGDGDGRVFDRFTKPVDVLAHEFGHAVVQHTADLVYEDQPGALNESLCDAFAACLKQRLLGQQAAEGDWLVGEGLFLPGVKARALRDLAAPGTAYDDPVLGRDPQVGHLDDYVVTDDDNGGVHLNSGIPNRAFQLSAVAIGGTSAEGAGRIWYDALTSGRIEARTDFAGFAAATIEVAGPHADAVASAWEQVGVEPAAGRSALAGSASASGSGPLVAHMLEVRRSGGFVGRTTTGRLDLDGDDPRVAEARELIARVDLTALGQSRPAPDAYVYRFVVDERSVAVPEQQLTAELRRLAALALPEEPGQ